MKMVSLIGVEHGYCSQCEQPSMIGRFEVRGWLYVFGLCKNCFSSLYEEFKQATYAGHIIGKEKRSVWEEELRKEK